jgi:glycosyltransferase involved in cell wall biosynthesis
MREGDEVFGFRLECANQICVESGPVGFRMNAAILVQDVGHYHHARFVAVTKQGRVNVTVIALSKQSFFPEFAPQLGKKEPCRIDTLFNDRTDYLRAVANGTLRSKVVLALQQHALDVIAVSGWADPEGLIAVDWARANGKGIILMSESQEIDAPRPWHRECVNRRVVSACDAALVGGSRHEAYVAQLGMPRSNIWVGYDAVDNNHFDAGSKAVRQNAAKLRAEHDLPKRYFLASARFVPKKNLPNLVRAFAAYAASVPPPTHHLVILGDGAERRNIEAVVSELRVGHLVHLPGFRRYGALPIYYGLASAFVHVSTVEQWGLVVNEAAAASLPLIVSEACGCGPELVREGVNGYRVDALDITAIADRLRRLALDATLLKSMGRESRRIVGDWGTERFARSFVDAAELARERARSRQALSLPDRCLLRLLSRQRFTRVV